MVPTHHLEIIAKSNVPALMEKVRPAWKSKNLISRVERLLQVDPSSACQRILNAAIHDLREKVIVAGVDIQCHKVNEIEKTLVNTVNYDIYYFNSDSNFFL